ncbi:peptidoglycan-binding domain-containing protein [Brevundimonas sanguinis]|uniref:peptidoglycan-binding domain-containing protein n=1 Tax=Brevundimonas sanguinis TaxID=3021811 RepID=UPI002414E723|nr:peptidoglycan-binding domain-containing protein [Brevundimonas sp. NCCP 15609]
MSIMSDDDFVRLFQRTFGLTEDGWAGRDTEAKLRELAALAGATLPSVPASEIPADYWPMLSKIESADRPYVQAASSSASGLYQFIRSTWIGEGGKWGPTLRPAFGGLKPSPEEQLARAKTFTAKNAAVLKAKGIPINKASLYAAHFFGAGMAAKVIGSDVNARADLIAGPEATKANPSILQGKTVGQFLTWLHKKTGEWAR